MASNKVFSSVASINKPRSRFDLSNSLYTSGSAGYLYPLPPYFVYPGDQFKIDTRVVARVTSSFLKPVFDNAFIDLYFFFVPYRLIWKDWEKFITGGDSPSNYQVPYSTSVPSCKFSDNEVFSGTVADYLGLPVGPINVGTSSSTLYKPVSLLPFRAYAKVYNDWFRNENFVDEVLIQTGDAFITGDEHDNEVVNAFDSSPSHYTGLPFKVSKLNDYFTSCLPSTQKGPAVEFPLGVKFGNNYGFPVQAVPEQTVFPSSSTPVAPLVLGPTNVSTGPVSLDRLSTSPSGQVEGYSGDVSDGTLVAPYNLLARTGLGSTFSVSDLRSAVQTQRLYERLARGGSRYTEYIQNAFGVTTSDAALQRAQFLGGKRIPLSVQQVPQTSQATSDSPLGNVAAFSLSAGQSRVVQAFKEHGIVLPVFVVRHYHTYQQGIARDWLNSERFDFYDPVFSHLSEQPVYSTELFAASAPQVFGYNEPYAYMRYRPNMVTGQMRSSATNTLDIWHFADKYSSVPILSKSFIEETNQFIDRTLSVQASSQDQFIFNFYFKTSAYRCLPTYGTPGLVDHY